MVAKKAKAEGKDPKKASKAAISYITKAGKDAGIKPGPKDLVKASAKLAAKEGKDPKEAAHWTAKHIAHKVENAKKTGEIPSHGSTPVHHTTAPANNKKHDTVVKPGTPGPKDIVHKAAETARKAGKDPKEAAKKAVTEITKAGAKAGIKPGPKEIVKAASAEAKKEGKDPKKAAEWTAHHIAEKAQKEGKAPPVHSATHTTPTPKQVVKKAAEKAKEEGKDPKTAAKQAVTMIKKAAAKDGGGATPTAAGGDKKHETVLKPG